MKIGHLILYLIFSVIIGCDAHKGNEKEVIISKIYHKKNSSEMDTLWVSQNDTTVFKKEEVVITRPCSNPQLSIHYELINPQIGAYYFIYNNTGKLDMDGLYTKEYTYEGATTMEGNFYNSRTYYYDWFGDLTAIHYQEDGRNLKTEVFDSKKRLEEIIYFDKKSEDKTKVEIYDKGKLEKTHIYTSFNNYYVEKANN